MPRALATRMVAATLVDVAAGILPASERSILLQPSQTRGWKHARPAGGTPAATDAYLSAPPDCTGFQALKRYGRAEYFGSSFRRKGFRSRLLLQPIWS